jgi:hypothetical protein
VQRAYAPPSTAHAKLAPAGTDTNASVASVWLVRSGGPFVILVSGTTPTDHVRPSGVGSGPPGPTARTAKLYDPGRRPLYVSGELQLTKAPPWNEHWKAAPDGTDSKVNVADVAVVEGDGPLRMRVSGAGGGVIVQVTAAAGRPVPALFTARTRKVYVAGASPVNGSGEAHGEYAPLPSLHSNVVVGSAGVATNAKVALVLDVLGGGRLVICTTGRTATVQVAFALSVTLSTFGLSVASTSNVCKPLDKLG